MITLYVDKKAIIAKDGTILTENVPPSVLAEKDATIKELVEALKPFAQFLFSKSSCWNNRPPDAEVLYGYTDDGKPNGLNVTLGDMAKARELFAKYKTPTP